MPGNMTQLSFAAGSTSLFYVDSYRNLIVNLRMFVQDPNTLSHQLPVLPAQQNPPTQIVEVVLRTDRRTVRLRIRRDNLYLDGYQDQGGQWHEFNNQGNEHLIPGSNFLGFTGSYLEMQRVARAERQAISLGRSSLIAAVNNLADTGDAGVRAHALIVIIQMVCESMRFRFITDTIANNWANSFQPSDRIVALENGWGLLSGALLHADNDPTGPIRLVRPNSIGINSIADAILVLGILLRQHATPRSKPLGDVAMETAAGQTLILDGRPLVEVFYVRILNIDGEDPGQLYGTITATDGLQSYYIYNRNSGNHEPVSPGGLATLTGPSRAISAAGDFFIDFNLMDHDSLSPDDEISRSQVAWNVYDHTNVYDMVRTTTIGGKYGSAALNYVVMSNAAEALVEVILINGDGEDPADVYGRIYSQNSAFGGEIDLFRSANGRESHHRAYLWDYDTLSSDDEIAKGTAEFKPEILKSVSRFIAGKYGKVEVRVSWF
ncbi:protein synthesis inhibitor I [Diplogelasinospora grovesii]|uniref:Protein synthesis inhibitor I n=1 Tax=Diplogelasinospora grovesii TaxID=303347 RepID=A0AAN6S0N6_9PEZI|nr:protein synthesis inhibitor I [Diplogelasinospora grovesii]